MDENPYRSPLPCEPGPKCAVAVLNDDRHTFAYVIETFVKVFGYTPNKSYALAHAIHTEGRAVVWIGPVELAERARDQICSAGPDLYATEKVDFPLAAVIEPLEPADADAAARKLESAIVKKRAVDAVCGVLFWGGSAVVVASWVDAVTPNVGWAGFAVAGVGWLLHNRRPRDPPAVPPPPGAEAPS